MFLNGQKKSYKHTYYESRGRVDGFQSEEPRGLSREARTWTGSWGGQATSVATPDGQHLSALSQVPKLRRQTLFC